MKKRASKGAFFGRETLLPLIAVLAAALAAVMFITSAPRKPVGPPKKVSMPLGIQRPAPEPPPAYAPEDEALPAEGAEPYKPAGIIDDGSPRIAIVIDDMGVDMAHLSALVDMSVPIGIAVLPYQPYSKKTAIAAKAAGLDVLLHLPMQADVKYAGLGDGALFTDMGSGEISDIVGRDLGEVPGAIGVNNHMGSMLTADKAAMTFVLSDLKARGLFFLDSRTTAETVAESTAIEMGVPTAARKVFLDDSNDIEDVRLQFERLVKLATKNGEAIAIGHPRPATLRVLGEELPKLNERGIRVVRVSTLVK